MKISITRALAELKNYDSKIVKSVQETRFIDIYQNRADRALKSVSTKDEFERKARASYDKVTDLIDRRNEIKRKVLMSNAVTKVTISGKEMTVVEAIEYKNSIHNEQVLLDTMRNQHHMLIHEINASRIQLENQVEKMVTQNLGKDRKADKDEYDAVAKPVFEANEMRLLDPLKLQDKIAELEKKISDFSTEVDFVLSESNSRTEIEVSD